jgi:two-component sensor histidine kinase
MQDWDASGQDLELAPRGEPEIRWAFRQGAIAERLSLREFVHRTNGELAAAIGLVSLAAFRCENDEARVSLRKVDRLEGHVCIQNSLRPPDYSTTIDISSYIYRLCRAVSRSKLEQQQIDLTLSLQPLV